MATGLIWPGQKALPSTSAEKVVAARGGAAVGKVEV